MPDIMLNTYRHMFRDNHTGGRITTGFRTRGGKSRGLHRS